MSRLHPPPHRRGSSRSGFTLLELSIATAILAILGLGLHGLIENAFGSQGRASTRASLALRGARTVDRLEELLRYLETEPFCPSPPFGLGELTFRRTELGPDGELQAGSLTRLSHDAGSGELRLTRRLGEPGELTTVLCRGIPALAPGEEFNFADDNGNGLVDEGGLSFTREGDAIVIRLSLAAGGRGGEVLERTFLGRVHARNAMDE